MKKAKEFQIGLLVVFVCFIVALSGCTSSDNTSSSNGSSSNASSSNGVNVEVSYPGNWGGSASGAFGYRGLSGNGDQKINLGSISGSLTVSTWKTDSSTGTMTVTITKDGKTLGTQSNSYGSATVTTTV